MKNKEDGSARSLQYALDLKNAKIEKQQRRMRNLAIFTGFLSGKYLIAGVEQLNKKRREAKGLNQRGTITSAHHNENGQNK